MAKPGEFFRRHNPAPGTRHGQHGALTATAAGGCGLTGTVLRSGEKRLELGDARMGEQLGHRKALAGSGLDALMGGNHLKRGGAEVEQVGAHVDGSAENTAPDVGYPRALAAGLALGGGVGVFGGGCVLG